MGGVKFGNEIVISDNDDSSDDNDEGSGNENIDRCGDDNDEGSGNENIDKCGDENDEGSGNENIDRMKEISKFLDDGFERPGPTNPFVGNDYEDTDDDEDADNDEDADIDEDWGARRFHGAPKGSGPKKWDRNDAISALAVEFWLHHPDHQPGDAPSSNSLVVDPNHPQYSLYNRLVHAINRYYDSIETDEAVEDLAEGDTSKKPSPSKRRGKAESNLVRNTKNRVREAAIAFARGGYSDKGNQRKHWTSLLPDQADLMVSRFLDPHGAVNGTIAGCLEYMGLGWMGSITSSAIKHNITQDRTDDNAAVVAVDAAAKAMSAQEEIKTLTQNLDALRDQVVPMVRSLIEKQKEVTRVVDSHAGVIDNITVTVSQRVSEELKKQVADVKKQVADVKKQVVEEVKKQVADVKKRVAEEVKKQVADVKKQAAEEVKKQVADVKKQAAEEVKKQVAEEVKKQVGTDKKPTILASKFKSTSALQNNTKQRSPTPAQRIRGREGTLKRAAPAESPVGPSSKKRTLGKLTAEAPEDDANAAGYKDLFGMNDTSMG